MRKTLNRPFEKLFFYRELGPLLGKKGYNLMVLVAMLFFTFSVVGFAEGSLRYLERKMKDPFINWLTVLPSLGSGMNMGMVIGSLNTEEVKTKYNLKNAIGFNRFRLNFYDYEDILKYYQTGALNTGNIQGISARTFDTEDPVLKEIFSTANTLSGGGFMDEMDPGLVVTEDFLKNLSYPLNTSYVWMDFLALRSYGDELRVAIPVSVNAVVKALPGMSGFGSTPYFYQQRSLEFRSSPFNPMHDNRLLIAFDGSREEVSAFIHLLEETLETMDVPGGYELRNSWYESRKRGEKGETYLVFLNFNPGIIDLDHQEQIFKKLYNHHLLSPYRGQFFRMYDYERNFTSPRQTSRFDRISLNFSNLDKLREFSEMLRMEYNIELDMAQIESRENYYFVSSLTGIISLVLIAFSILSVLLFIGHLLKKHLESIKRNLGTFKAFGLSNKKLINIYINLSMSILGAATIVSLALASLFGYMGGMRMVLMLFKSQIEAGRYFSIFSPYLLLSLILLAVFSVVVLRLTTRRILIQSPGDLIYERH